MKTDTTPANRIIQQLIDAMKRSSDEGSTDHLDCTKDEGAFWYEAIEKAEKFLND